MRIKIKDHTNTKTIVLTIEEREVEAVNIAEVIKDSFKQLVEYPDPIFMTIDIG